jgi:hypothetical protein
VRLDRPSEIVSKRSRDLHCVVAARTGIERGVADGDSMPSGFVPVARLRNARIEAARSMAHAGEIEVVGEIIPGDAPGVEPDFCAL